MEELFFKDWEGVLHVALATLIAFVTLFLFVRISGKRTLAKLNAFDFVVTVALGSVLAYMMLATVPLVEGTVVLLLIIALQYLFAHAAKSSSALEHIINAVPELVFYEGKFLDKAMAREGITEDEIYAAIRHEGIEHINDVRAAVMELNGEITVVRKSNSGGKTSLDDFKEKT